MVLMTSIYFLNYFLFAGSNSELMDDLEYHVTHSKSFACEYLSCLNPHSFAVAKVLKPFNVALSNAKWLIPDGVGCIVGARLLGSRCTERIAGFDVFYKLSERINVDYKVKVFFLGSTDETLKKITEKYAYDFQNIEIAGSYSPPFQKKFDDDENKNIITRINNSGADVVWVGLSSPKQDIWMYENKRYLNARLALGIGAVFDFYAGNVPRSPNWVQKLGFEWLHRLTQEPKRLWGRTFISGPIFILSLFVEFWNIKIGSK